LGLVTGRDATDWYYQSTINTYGNDGSSTTAQVSAFVVPLLIPVGGEAGLACKLADLDLSALLTRLPARNERGALSLLGKIPVGARASSEALAKNLEGAGVTRPANTDAHHIVAGGAKKAGPAQAVLKRFGININDANNGVFLPSNKKSPNPTGAAVHRTLHTNDYYDEVNALLTQATTRQQVLDMLSYIRSQLLSGGFP